MKHQRKWQHLKIILAGCLILAHSVVGLAQSSQNDDKSEKSKMRQRLEQLFVWRVSDRLGLNTEEEAKFNEEYKKLSDERIKVAQKTDHILDQLSQETTDKGKARLLSEWEEAVKEMNQSQLKEVAAMKKIFDTKRLADYVLLKRDMFHKFRDVLTSQTSVAKNPSGKPPLKEPEVYQEK